MDLLTTALELHAVSLSPLPVAADGSKRPRIAWKEYAAAALASISRPPRTACGRRANGGSASTGPHLGELAGDHRMTSPPSQSSRRDHTCSGGTALAA